MFSSVLRFSRNISLKINLPVYLAPMKTPFKINSNFLKTSLFGQEPIIRYLNFQSFNNFTTNIQKAGECKQSNILGDSNLLQTTRFDNMQTRTVTKFSLRKGKRKSCKVVLKKFKRLDWGVWIHGKCGRQKKLYKKSANRIRRLRQHVFCNASQSWLLDKMVTKYWRKPRHYVDDPYEPYHLREEFHVTRKKPITPFD